MFEHLAQNQWFCRLLGSLLLVVGAVSFTQRFTDSQFDFASDYATTKATIAGENPYADPLSDIRERLPDVAVEISDAHTFPNWRPPFRFLTTWPFTLIGFTTASALWMLLDALSLLAAVFIVGRSIGWKPTTAIVVAIGSLSVPAVAQDLALGQVNGVLLLLLVLAWVGVQRGRRNLTGMTLGAAIAVKVFPALLLIPLLAHRRFREAATALASATALSLMGLWFIGFGHFDDFVATTLNGYGPFRAYEGNVSLAGRVGPIGLVIALLCVIILWRVPHRASGDWFWASIPFVLLAWPIVWGHYLVLVIPWVLLSFRPTPLRAFIPLSLLVVPIFLWMPPTTLLLVIAVVMEMVVEPTRDKSRRVIVLPDAEGERVGTAASESRSSELRV